MKGCEEPPRRTLGSGVQALETELSSVNEARSIIPPKIAPARAAYQQALAQADELGMRPLQAHCHQGLGTLYAATDQRKQAQTALSMAIELYRAMDMAFWLPQAEAVLAQAGGAEEPEGGVP